MSKFNNNRSPYSASNSEIGGVNIDIKRVFYQATRYWYLIVTSIISGLVIAYLVNRYSTKIYSITASIIIKESEEVSGGEFLLNNPLVKFYRNYLNEIYIIRSTPLIERTVEELEFDRTFYRVGKFKTTESYKTSPIDVEIIGNVEEPRLSFDFVLLNQSEIELIFLDHGKEKKLRTGFNQIVQIDSIRLRFLNTVKFLEPDLVGSVFSYSHQSSTQVAQIYAARLTANWAEEGAGVINLSIRGSNPKKEIDFLNGLIKNYQEYDLEKKNQAASNTIDFIGAQLDNIIDSLNNAQRQLETFKNKIAITDLSAEAVRLTQKLEELELQKTDLILRENYYKYITDYVANSKNLDQVILPSAIGITDPIINGLVSEMIGIQSDIKMMAHKEKQNPLLLEAEKRIQILKDELLESVKNQKAVDKIKLNFLAKSIGDLDQKLNYLPVAERQLVNIKRNYTLLENLYVFLLQKKAEAGISRASNTTDIVLVNPPTATGPIAPSIIRNYLLGFTIGLTFPFILIVLFELLNTRVQSREDVEKLTAIPFIGGVGHKQVDENLEVLVKPKSAISESFRALRSNLNYFIEGREKGVFLITSSVSGEGKTFTSINLASVFALSGKRTLIVGADMRKPKIYSDFDLDNSIGLSSYLAGLSKFEDVVRTTKFENLSLVSGGPVPPNPSELILSKRMVEFLASAKQQFDFIFIDSPPLALVTDAFVLSGLVDHTLFIVRQNYTPKPLLKTIDDFYNDGKIQKISLVLNDIYKSGPGYGYGYSYGYGYHYGYGVSSNSGSGYYE